MWHEQRKEEKRIRGMLVDRRKRAERRRDYYEKIRGDPNQFLQVHGSSIRVHLDPSIAIAADSPANMMPWAGDSKIIIDRFDARANLDMIPENNFKANKAELSKEESREMRQVNYERYRILIQNEYLSIGEEKFLKTIDLEEKFGGTTYQGNRAKEEKKKSANKAAIGFIYHDSAPAGPEPDSDSDSMSDSEPDFDLSVDVMSLGTAQQHEINKIGATYEMGKKDFVKYLARDVEELEEVKMAKDKELEKSNISGRKSRRQRRVLKERRMEGKAMSPPSYAARKTSKSKSKSQSRSSESESDVGEGKVEFITSFGGDSDQEAKKETPKKEQKVSKSKAKGEYSKPIGPKLPRKRSRSRSRRRHGYRSRSRSRGRYRRSRSRSRRSRSRGRRSRSKDWDRRRYNRRSRSRSRSARRSSRSRSRERERIEKRLTKAFSPPPRPPFTSKRKSSSSSSDSSESDKEDGGTTRYRSKYRNKKADSSDDSDVDDNDKKNDENKINAIGEIKGESLYHNSMSSFFNGIQDKSGEPRQPEAAPQVEPPPVRRYYGRRKEEESDSELSVDSDSDRKSPTNQPCAVISRDGNQGERGKSSIKEEKNISIKEKLRKKMLQQIKKTFKEDKKAEQERQKKMEEEQFYREEELKEMSEKLRLRERERRRLAGESESEEEAGEYSPLTALWRREKSDRSPEDRRRRSPVIERKRSRERRSRTRSRSKSRSRSREREGKSKNKIRISAGPRLVDY